MNRISKNITLVELAGIICEHLQSREIQVILVGGAVVTIYSNNEYQSRDLDFISPNDRKQIGAAMAELGFHSHTLFTVEFSSGPLAIGNAIPVKAEGEFKALAGTIRLLSQTQCVMDRLAWLGFITSRIVNVWIKPFQWQRNTQ